MPNKKRRRPNRATVAASAPPGSAAAEARAPWAMIGLFTAGLVVYVALFYFTGPPLESLRAKDDGSPWRRSDFLLPLVAPEIVWQGWFGDAAEFSVLDRVPIVAGAAAVIACSGAVGWLLVQLLRAEMGLTRLERAVFSLALGLAATSLYTLLVGLAGVLGNVLVFGVPAALAIAFAARLQRRRAAAAGGDPVEPNAAGGGPALARGWLLLGAPFVAAILAGAMLPPVDFDVREYHLQAPKEFYEQGRITFVPHNVYANMALGTEMLSLAGMVVMDDWWQGALVGKTVIGCFAPLTALGLLAAGRRLFSPTAGITAAVVYIATPWVARLSTTGLVEGASACYLLLAVYAVILWRDAAGAHDRAATGRLLLAGALAGAAVATKYPAALFVLAPLTMFVAVCQRRFDAKSAGLFVLAAAVVCGPWFVKNWVLAGNPTYPLLYGAFDGRTRTPEKNAQWIAAHRPPNYSPTDLARRAADVLLYSDWLNPFMVPLAAMAYVAGGRRWHVAVRRGQRQLATWLLAYFGFVLLVWWLFTHRIDRFWLPALPLVALLAGAGAAWSAATAWRRVVAAVLLVAAVVNIIPVTAGPGGFNRYFVSLARLRSEPPRVDPWIAYLNATVEPTGAVLAVGDAAVFDLEVPVIYNTTFDDSIFERIIAGRSTEAIRDALRFGRERPISHVYVNWSEIARYRAPGNYGFTDFVRPEVFADLVDRGVLEPPMRRFADAGVEIYRVAAP